MKIKLFLPILLLCVFLFSNITYAADVSSGDLISNFSGRRIALNDVTLVSPEIYYTPSQNNYTFNYYFQIPDVTMNNNSDYSVLVYFNYNLSTSARGASVLADFSISYNGSLYKPYYHNNGLVYFSFTVEGNNTNEFNLLINTHLQSTFSDLYFTSDGTFIYPQSWTNTTVHLNGINVSSVLIGSSSDGFLDSIFNFLLSWSSNLSTQLGNYFNTLFDKLDNDQDELINGFNSQTGNDAGSNFDSSAADLGAAEDSLFEAASYDNIDYSEFEGFFSLTGVSSALSLLKTLMESLYNNLGIFGVPITIGLILLVITRILGYQNFTAGGG